MTRLVSSTLLLVLGTACASGEQGPPASGDALSISEGISRGKPGNVWISRNRRDPRYLFVEPGLPKERMFEILRANPLKRVVSTDGSGDIRSYTLTWNVDSGQVAQWEQDGRDLYLVASPVGEFRLQGSIGAVVHSHDPLVLAPYSARKEVSYTLVSGQGRPCVVRVYVGIDAESTDALLHELLLPHIRNTPRLTKVYGTPILESDDHKGEGHYATWYSEPDVVVSVHSLDYPKAVLSAFARKHPSAISPQFDCGQASWVGREVAVQMAALRQSIDEPNSRLVFRARAPTWKGRLSRLARTLDVSAIVDGYNATEKKLYTEHIRGGNWRQDYDSYRSSLQDLREDVLSKLEAALGRAAPSLASDSDGNEVAGSASGRSAFSTLAVAALVVAILLIIVVALIVVLGRRASAQEK